MIKGEVNTVFDFALCLLTVRLIIYMYMTRLMMAINSHPWSPRCTDFRIVHSQCWTNFDVMGRARVTEDRNSLAQTILEHFLENIASEIYEKVFIMLVECYSHTLREISYRFCTKCVTLLKLCLNYYYYYYFIKRKLQDAPHMSCIVTRQAFYTVQLIGAVFASHG